MPLVTVGMPVFNGEAFVAQALRGILAQSHRNLEIVVSDNRSTDTTASIVESFARQDGRIRFVRAPQNEGVSWNFNKVLDLAHGEYFMWHAADDMMSPAHISECLSALMSTPGANIAFSQVQVIDSNGNSVGPYDDEGLNFLDLAPAERVHLYLHRKVYQVIGYGGVTRTSEMRAAGGHPRYTGGDVVLGVTMAFRGVWVQVPQRLFHMRFHDSQVNKDQGRDIIAQVKAHKPEFRRIVAFPQWYLNYRILREAAVAPVSLGQRAKAMGFILHDWTIPNWRSFPVDIKRNILHLVSLVRMRCGARGRPASTLRQDSGSDPPSALLRDDQR